MSTAAERWAEVAALFDELVELDSDIRERRLAELNAGDPILAAEVRSLLAADDGQGSLLDSDAPGAIPGIRPLQVDSRPVDGIAGPWRLLHALGEGGMGVVWLAERTDGAYEQQVAVKVLKRGMDTQAILRRFLQERRILARLHHPHIVRLVDGGMSSDERPYYVMDYVDGQSITEYAAQHSLDVRARVALLAEIADAVAYAHTQLVVHRDLKPSNILVDREGKPRVLDFGIAKLIEESGEQSLTGTGLRVMSPAYAAPEQILGEPIGTATDVYALGLMLCEMLTGQLPQHRNNSTPAQLALEASQEIVDRASTLATRLKPDQLHALYGSDIDTRQLSRSLTGDLDLIIATALQRDPARRYATAAAFADDLRRWLDARPIAARADSAAYRFNRFVRRHRVGVAATTTVLLALVGGLGASLWQADKARHQAELADRQAQRADSEAVSARQSEQRSRRVTDFLISVFTQEDPLRHSEDGATTLAQAFDASLKRIDTEFADDPMLQGELLDDFGEILTTKGDFDHAQGLLDRALALAEQTHDANDPAIAETLVNLGVLAAYRGDILPAKPYLQRAVAILELHERDRPGEYANALSTLAEVVRQEGNMREGARMLQRVLEIEREANATPDKMVAALTNVANSQTSLGNFDEAESRANEALSLSERAFGKESANLIPSLWTLERTAYHRGDFKRQQQLVERELAIARTAFPPGHPWVTTALGASGFALMLNGKAKEGEARMRDALHLLEQSGNKGLDMQMIQRRLWIGLRQNGDAKAAQAVIEAAWKNCSAQGFQQNMSCLVVRASRAQSLAEAGQGELALVEAEAAQQGLKKALGERSEELAQALEAHASALLALQRHDAAIATQREAADMFEAVNGAQHFTTLRARKTLTQMQRGGVGSVMIGEQKAIAFLVRDCGPAWGI
jgi:eukaryotic-like serine/threonine-protein kinase